MHNCVAEKLYLQIQTGKDKYLMISLIYGSKNDANELVYKIEIDSQA